MTPGVAELFERLRSGNQSALNDLVTALYPELRRLAARKLGQNEQTIRCKRPRWCMKRT